MTAVDYGKILARMKQDEPGHAAVPVLHADTPTRKRLTRKRSRGSLAKKRKRMATRAQIAAARRNIKKAQAALRRKRGGGRKRRAREDDPRRRGRRRRRAREEGVIRRSRRSGKFTRRKRGSRVAGRVDEAPRRRRRRARDVYEAPRRRRRRRARDEMVVYEAGRRRRRRHRAKIMENPMGLWESIGGFLGGTAGFVGASLADRGIATRKTALVKDVETPIYKSGWRLAAGAGLTVVPIGVAAFVRTPVLRSVLQLFGYGAGIYTIGKATIDGIAAASAKTEMGTRLFVAELSAQSALETAEKSATGGTTAGLPEGVGAITCPACGRRDGLGICCKRLGIPTTPPVVTEAPSPPAAMMPPPVMRPLPEVPTAPLPPPPTARVPGTMVPGLPPTAMLAPPGLMPAGVRGLGQAADDIVRAAHVLSSNRGLVEAVAQGRATPEQQRAYADLMHTHGHAIRTISQGVAGPPPPQRSNASIYDW